ncbi:MAG: CRISPR-associated CARF protein Csa3 [Fervidicoccaceae archaeon]
MKLVVVTVGFDEKLPLRGVLKVGLDVGDTVMLVYSKTGGEFEVKKVGRAVEVLKEIIQSTGAGIVEVVVPGTNFYDDVTMVLRSLREQKADEVVAVLAGGMRLVIFEVLFALLTLYRLGRFQRVRSKVFLMREDGLYDVALPLESFYVTIPRNGLVVMRIIHKYGEVKRSRLVETASREAGLSESAVYKIIKELEKRGLVILEDDAVKMTDLGRLLYIPFGD